MDIMIRMQFFILAFFMLLVIYMQLIKEGENYFFQYRLFKLLILTTMIIIVIDALGWVFNGIEGDNFRIIATITSILSLSIKTLPLILWTFYVDFELYSDIKRIKKSLKFYLIFMVINAILAISSPITKLYFYLDSENIYHRGNFIIFYQVVYYALFAYNFLLILVNWKRINNKNRLFLILILILPLSGLALQSIYYETSFAWLGVSLSILIGYITIQNQAIKIDYLTGLYNRRQLDYCLKNKIKGLLRNQSFAGIMIDIDHFKKINDKFGHLSGDRALEHLAIILKKSFKRNDFIARYAGDEFVVLSDIKKGEVLEEKVRKLQKNIALYNLEKKEEFEIHISIGYAIYDSKTNISSDEFLNLLDKLMYNNKKHKYF